MRSGYFKYKIKEVLGLKGEIIYVLLIFLYQRVLYIFLG